MEKAILRCLLGSLAAAGVAVAAPVLEARAPAVALAQNTLPLTRNLVHNPDAQPRSLLRGHRLAALAAYDETPDPVAPAKGSAVAAQNQIEYLTDVKAGPNNFSLIVDTGSSDTWFVKEGFQCLDAYRRRTSLAACHFGPMFEGDFPGGQIPNQHFNVTYGSANGPFLNGLMGYSDLTVAGVTVPKQQIGLATIGSWQGDGISSGILGLGLPGLTDAFTGTDTSRDSLSNMVAYHPLVTTMASQLSPIFSLSLSRDPAQSFLAFGGVPAGVKTVGDWAVTPLTKVPLRTGSSEYLYYQITVDKFVWNSSLLSGQDASPPEFIVDSGTTLNLFPYEMARAINAEFVPHAVYDPDQGSWFVACDARPPSLGVQIGGKMIWTDPASMILPHVRDPGTGMCATGVGTTNGWPYILGDTFMQQLVTVFDISEKMQVSFAKRA